MRASNSDEALGNVVDKKTMRSHVDIDGGVLPMEIVAIQFVRKAKEKDGRHRAVPRAPREIPGPRLPVAEREDQVGHGQAMSNQCAHGCCEFAGIKSKSRHYAYKKDGELKKIFPKTAIATLSVAGLDGGPLLGFWVARHALQLALEQTVHRGLDLQPDELVEHGGDVDGPLPLPRLSLQAVSV